MVNYYLLLFNTVYTVHADVCFLLLNIYNLVIRFSYLVHLLQCDINSFGPPYFFGHKWCGVSLLYFIACIYLTLFKSTRLFWNTASQWIPLTCVYSVHKWRWRQVDNAVWKGHDPHVPTTLFRDTPTETDYSWSTVVSANLLVFKI